MNITSKYKWGDKVRVVSGVNDPDLNIKIEGWSGEINEVESPVQNGSWMYNIVLDKKTILIAGEHYILLCAEHNLDYATIYLEESELELIKGNFKRKKGVLIA